ncbi:MAG: ATP-dependent Clp protease adaptor ClpS [Bacteroidia bacterium]|jgi:ATP-dependent Clp protease adaptor protein ClpS
MGRFFGSIELEEDVLAIIQGTKTNSWCIVLFNDDYNTFDWVIECLVKYCEHDAIQAEQCAWFVHTKGKYTVKLGSKTELKPICETLLEKGLSAKLIPNNE